jgi:hypothetical protein
MQLILNREDHNYYFEKGYRFHKSKQYRDAWEAWVTAHGLYNGNYQVAAANQILHAIINLRVEEHDLEDQGEGLIFIVGLPRSGTSLLEQVLITQGNTYGRGERREFVAILDDALLNKDFNLDINTIKGYQSFYRKEIKNKAKYYVDKMPRNVLAIPLIKLVFPKCKIIHTNRDRFSTCMSIYASNFSDHTPYAHRWETLNIFYDHCSYVANKFKDLIYDISFEKVVTDFESTIKDLYQYLDFKYTGKEIEFYKNKTTVNTCSREQVKNPLNTNGLTQWLPYKPIVLGVSDDDL